MQVQTNENKVTRTLRNRCIAETSGKSTADRNVHKPSDTQPIQVNSSKRKQEGKANSPDKEQNATARTTKAKEKTNRCTEVSKEKVIYSK